VTGSAEPPVAETRSDGTEQHGRPHSPPKVSNESADKKIISMHIKNSLLCAYAKGRRLPRSENNFSKAKIMLTISDVSNLVKLETEYNTAVEHRTAARKAANLADFQCRANLEVCEHAINLQQALKKNRFHEAEEAYTPAHHMLMDMHYKARDLYRQADAAYKNANTAVEQSFYALEEARKSATFSAP